MANLGSGRARQYPRLMGHIQEAEPLEVDLACEAEPTRFRRVDEVHHIVVRSRGGPTRSNHLLGLCWYHHHLVNEGGWDLVGDANAEVKGTGLDGRVWKTGPPGG